MLSGLQESNKLKLKQRLHAYVEQSVGNKSHVERITFIAEEKACLFCDNTLNQHPVGLPLLAMRPATVNWTESFAAPLPLFFDCSSFSFRIFILSASDILGSTSTVDFCWKCSFKRF